MNKNKRMPFFNSSRWIRAVLSLAAVTVLAGCPVDSTSVSDADLIATFLVQNDNGQARTTVTFASSDNAGRNVVNLVAEESISYLQGDVTRELGKSGDGEYTATLPSTAADWYSFILIRESEDREYFEQEIVGNYVYLPASFQDLQVEPQQFGAVITVNWAVDNNAPQSINGFTTQTSEDTFNAIASCQQRSGVFDVAITEGQIVQQNGISLLEIPVTEHLQQVSGLSAEAIATLSCEFDVQLVRTIIGATDIALDGRSSARGQVLQNITIQWMGQ